MKAQVVIFLVILLSITSCTNQTIFFENFNNTNDRIWIGKDYWAIPLEDWKVEDGKLHCAGHEPQARVNLLTHVLSESEGEFEASVIISLTGKGSQPGSAGFLIGIEDEEDPDVRAACYFGKGIAAGVSEKGYAFLMDKKIDLPEKFDFDEFNITLKGSDKRMKMEITDKNGLRVKDLSVNTQQIRGLVAIAANLITGENEKPGNSNFSFDNLKLAGSKVEKRSENAFGPILWTMYTLNNNQVKLMALLPPLGENDNKEVHLELRQGFTWRQVASETIEPDSRTVVFRIDNWDSSRNVDYRVGYREPGAKGTETVTYYNGAIRRDPADRPLKLAALSSQYTSAFPYSPLVKNLAEINPDLLYFSGDQVYDTNGGYPAKRTPDDASILSYLGKYYMFGWAFGDLMRDRPTICTPDASDFFHENLWGQGGVKKPAGAGSNDTRGFIQSPAMVNVVTKTQCGQLPDPYDPTPIKQGINTWYTALTYGKVNFAIISDRIYKTGPEAVSDWKGRKDHLKEPRQDMSFLDKPGVELTGERQNLFLQEWILDWKDTDMKVLLSQTVFANPVTHHGSPANPLHGDLNSGGWPKSGRDKVIHLMRKGAAFHISGDQHLPTLVQYGLNDYRDAGWSFNSPAISNLYMRWFLPDQLDVPATDRPEHEYPNTGKYTDAFGNKNFVYAVGNPGDITADSGNRYNNAQLRVSGFGIVTFDKRDRTIEMDSWRFLADVKNPNPGRDQFPGWPVKISQFDNLGNGAQNMLPLLKVNKANQLIRIIDQQTSEIVNIYRIHGNEIQPLLFESGTYSVIIGEGQNTIEINDLVTQTEENNQTIEVEL